MEKMFNFGNTKPANTTSRGAFDFGNVSVKPPPSSYGNNVGASRAGRPIGTSSGATSVRPVTSNQKAGFNSNNLNQTGQMENTRTRFDVNRKVDSNPEENFRKA